MWKKSNIEDILTESNDNEEFLSNLVTTPPSEAVSSTRCRRKKDNINEPIISLKYNQLTTKLLIDDFLPPKVTTPAPGDESTKEGVDLGINFEPQPQGTGSTSPASITTTSNPSLDLAIIENYAGLTKQTTTTESDDGESSTRKSTLPFTSTKSASTNSTSQTSNEASTSSGTSSDTSSATESTTSQTSQETSDSTTSSTQETNSTNQYSTSVATNATSSQESTTGIRAMQKSGLSLS